MKTFKDITWKQHRIVEGAIQGLLDLPNGRQMSIVAGPSLYSLPRETGKAPEDFDKFEVAIFKEDGEFLRLSEDDDVLGWQTRGDINSLILLHG